MKGGKGTLYKNAEPLTKTILTSLMCIYLISATIGPFHKYAAPRRGLRFELDLQYNGGEKTKHVLSTVWAERTNRGSGNGGMAGAMCVSARMRIDDTPCLDTSVGLNGIYIYRRYEVCHSCGRPASA